MGIHLKPAPHARCASVVRRRGCDDAAGAYGTFTLSRRSDLPTRLASQAWESLKHNLGNNLVTCSYNFNNFIFYRGFA
jgi:hypothetical protein